MNTRKKRGRKQEEKGMEVKRTNKKTKTNEKDAQKKNRYFSFVRFQCPFRDTQKELIFLQVFSPSAEFKVQLLQKCNVLESRIQSVVARSCMALVIRR